MIQDVASGLQFLMDKKYGGHLNIKPSNVLNCRGNFKLVDMVMARDRIVLAQNRYIAPELIEYYIDGATDLSKCDVYSLGLTILENITGNK